MITLNMNNNNGRDLLIFIIFLFIVIMLFSFMCRGQTPYAWQQGVNPGWVASNNTNTHLSWQNGAGSVSTSNYNFQTGGWYAYTNGQNSTYTSPSYNMPCELSPNIHISYDIMVNLEDGFDYLYFEHSLNGGLTWSIEGSYTGVINTTIVHDLPSSNSSRFRFRFVSDNIVNSYCSNYHWLLGCLETSVFYADILNFTADCMSYLPIELIKYTVNFVEGFSKIQWETASETNSSHYILEYSYDGYFFNHVTNIKNKGNSNSINTYNYTHKPLETEGVVYYRLKEEDINGFQKTIGIRSVIIPNKVVDKTVNLLGQEVGEHYKGVIIVIYEDGSRIKQIR